MFSLEIKKRPKLKIKTIMSGPPLTIDGEANLMEAAYLMFTQKARRLAVTKSGAVAGIIREQDLFFEMERIVREMKSSVP
jgi:signal-transduction protein with cAMP-binding, CBS, and nucleotidyltransferase domain